MDKEDVVYLHNIYECYVICQMNAIRKERSSQVITTSRHAKPERKKKPVIARWALVIKYMQMSPLAGRRGNASF